MGAVLLHHYRSVRASRMTRHPSDLDAITALASGVLCRDDCASHTIGYSTEAGICLVCFDTPSNCDLETLYPQRIEVNSRGGPLAVPLPRYPTPLRRCPAPAEWNPPLGDTPRRSELAERLDRGHAVELARQLEPGRPHGRPFECAVCGRCFDADETVMYEPHGIRPGRAGGSPPTRTVHVACCSLVDGGRYETRYCACERSMIVAVTSPRRHCSHKCGLRVWRAARAAP